MAGDWIKMRPSLLTSPRVNGIARILESDKSTAKLLAPDFEGCMSDVVTRNVMRYVTVTALLSVWGAANEHTRDGVFQNADLSDIDDIAGVPGFGAAMVAVGWAEYDDIQCTVSLANFNEYNTSSQVRSAGAKTAAERQREYRERQKSQESDVTSDVTSNRREEKRREDISTTDVVDIPVTKKSASNVTSKRKRKTKIPDDFAVSSRVREWADEKGFDRLDEHLDAFRRKAVAKGYAYVAWDEAFMEAVREDWAKLRTNPRASPAQTLSFAERDELARRKRWESMTGRKWPTDDEAPHLQTIEATTLEIAHEPAHQSH